jgi:hypothetical protein
MLIATGRKVDIKADEKGKLIIGEHLAFDYQV